MVLPKGLTGEPGMPANPAHGGCVTQRQKTGLSTVELGYVQAENKPKALKPQATPHASDKITLGGLQT